MADDLEIRGAEQLDALARRIKQHGNAKEIRKELLRGIREKGKPVVNDVRESARRTLPKRGGLADLIGRSKIGVRTKLSGKSVGIAVQATGKQNLMNIDKGLLRHPVFGRGRWVSQSITPGFFTEPMEKSAPMFRQSITNVMQDIARKVEG